VRAGEAYRIETNGGNEVGSVKMNPARLFPLFALISGFWVHSESARAANPIITDVYTADPAALVHGGRVYLYVGQDEAPPKHHDYVMNRWLCYSSDDMVNWTPHGSPFEPAAFKWAKSSAWASQVVERDGKFYFYATVAHATIKGMAIGVGVSDSPTGPFVDARGSALITNDMTTDVDIGWDDIDPSVFIDDDGQAYLYWGNTKCRWAKLKPNMTELDGPIHTVSEIARFTEAPWVYKRNGLYYLTYSTDFPEKTVYATSDKPTGPWQIRGLINEIAGNCNTNHHAIIHFKGRDYFIYHNGAIQPHGGSYRRSVCIDYLSYNSDGTIRRVIMTSEGVGPAK
jgi:hypothetical protein